MLNKEDKANQSEQADEGKEHNSWDPNIINILKRKHTIINTQFTQLLLYIKLSFLILWMNNS